MMNATRWLTALVVGWVGCAAMGQDFNSQSDGTDGALNCATLNCPAGCDEANPCTVEIPLGLAATAVWNTPSPVPGRGVYDASEWAVVFKYTSIDIPAGVTVRFINHSKGAPVVWLATGDVTIAGTINLNGADGNPNFPSYAEPGPGGFAGGIRLSDLGFISAGFGPGGGSLGATNVAVGGGAYATSGGGVDPGSAVYGSRKLLPLIGGSGGGGRGINGLQFNGGAGAGAILIASSTRILLTESSSIVAKGGAGSGGHGAGGGIRLVSNQIAGDATLRATDPLEGSSGLGRIRLESPFLDVGSDMIPLPSIGLPGCLFPDPSTTPSLRVTHVDGVPVPTDPLARVTTDDLSISAESASILQIEAKNVPPGLTVVARFARGHSISDERTSTPLVGTFSLSTATIENVIFSTGATEVQLRVEIP